MCLSCLEPHPRAVLMALPAGTLSTLQSFINHAVLASPSLFERATTSGGVTCDASDVATKAFLRVSRRIEELMGKAGLPYRAGYEWKASAAVCGVACRVLAEEAAVLLDDIEQLDGHPKEHP